jgi:S-layer protein
LASDLGTGGFDLDDLTSVTVSATTNCDLGSTAAFPDATTWTAADSAGDVTCVFANKTAVATDVTITGGEGKDDFDISAFNANANATVNTGAEDDTITVDGGNVQSEWRIDAGAGEDTLVSATDFGGNDFSQEFTSFEAMKLTPAGGVTINVDMDDEFDGLPIDTFDISPSAATGNVTVTDAINNSVFTVNTQTGTLILDGQGGVVHFTLNMDIDTGTAELAGLSDGTGAVTGITINSQGAQAQKITDASGLAATEFIIAGGADLALNDALLSTSTTSVEAGSFTGNLAVSTGAADVTIVGGWGDDTITIDDTAASTVTGGAGQDTINLDGAAEDTIQSLNYLAPADGADVAGLDTATAIFAGDTVAAFEIDIDKIRFDVSGFPSMVGNTPPDTAAKITADNAGADFDLGGTTSVFVLDNNVATFDYTAGNALTLANLQSLFDDELTNVSIGDQAIFVIPDSDNNPGVDEFTVYLFEATDTDADLDADEIRCLGVFTPDDIAVDLVALVDNSLIEFY